MTLFGPFCGPPFTPKTLLFVVKWWFEDRDLSLEGFMT